MKYVQNARLFGHTYFYFKCKGSNFRRDLLYPYFSPYWRNLI